MIRDWLALYLDWRLTLSKADKLSWDHSPLVHQLVEAVLAISSWLTEDNRTGFNSSPQSHALTRDPLAVALHVKLLDVCREFQ